MSGDAANVALWSGADVYVADKGTAGPTDTTAAWPVAWSAVGLLDGEAGFTQSRDSDSKEFFAWGGLLTKKATSKHKRMVEFVMLEDNATTFGIVNPGSVRTTDVATGVTTSTIKVPASHEFAIGFEVRDGVKTLRRSALRAEVVKVDDITESETDPTVYKVQVVIYPEADGTIFHEVEK